MTDLGPYRLREELAVGGMAEVFLAEHHAPADVRRDVVVKRVLPQFIDDRDFRNMFLDEARLMAALSHPYIAQVYDVGLTRGVCYLVMEYIRGPTVRDLITAAARRGDAGLPRPAALSVALAVAEALDYVHTRKDPSGQPLGIVHRDLNPANVMIAYTGAVKLIDFGIAKAASRLHQTQGNIVRGTRGYIAPEQISRDTPLDHRADIFTMGVLLYELCLGRHPFGDEADARQLMRVVQGKFVPPERFDPRFPSRLSALLRSCFEIRPSERPRRMRDVVDTLAGYMRDTGESATLAEIGDLASVLVPDKASQHGIERPSPQTREQLAKAEALGPDELTEPSLVIELPEDLEDETARNRLADLTEDASTAEVEKLERTPERRTKAMSLGNSVPPPPRRVSAPDIPTGPIPSVDRAKAPPPVSLPPARPAPPQSFPPGAPLPPGAPPARDPQSYVQTMSMDALKVDPAAMPVTRPTLQGMYPPPRPKRTNYLLLLLVAVVLALGSALVVLLVLR